MYIYTYETEEQYTHKSLGGSGSGNSVMYGHFKQDRVYLVANWPVMYQFWSKYHLPIGNSNLPKNHSETSYLLNKLDVLFEMPVYDTIAVNPRLNKGAYQR